MTPEQQKAIAIATARARLAAKATAPVDKPVDKPELSGVDYARGLNQTFTKGASSGFSDEIVGAGRAAVDYLLPGGSEGGQSFGDRYRMYRDDERQSQQQFADENKGVAVAAEVAGAFGSPLNKAKLLTKGATGLSKATQLIARGGAEGALYGAGEAKEVEDIGKAAAVSGATGAAGQAVISGVGGAAGRALSNERVKEALWETLPSGKKVFKPLNLANPESPLGKIYRDVVAVAYGGEDISRQESAYLQKALTKALKGTSRETAEEQMTRLLPVEVGTKNALMDVGDAITDQRLLEQGRLSTALAKTKAELEKSANAKLANIASDTANTIATQESNVAGDVVKLRQQAALRSIPKEDIGRVLGNSDLTDPQEVSNKLISFWNNDAFRMVKDKPDFVIDEGIHNRIGSLMQEDAAFKAAIQSKLGPIEKLPEVIDGDSLMEIRNRFARGANDTTKGLDKYAQRKIAYELDDVITSQLDKEAKAAFLKQKELYPNYLAYTSASKKAYSESGGKFNAKQLRMSAQGYGDPRTGKVPFDDISLGVREGEAGLTRTVRATKQGSKVASDAEKAAMGEAQSAASLSTSHKVHRAKQRERAAKRFVKTMSRGVTTENPSVGNKLVATAALGAPIGTMTGHIATLPVGFGVAKTLSKPGVQTYLAGQTQWQKDLAEALRSGGTDPYGRSINRALIGQSGE